jgi:hypothetical protein
MDSLEMPRVAVATTVATTVDPRNRYSRDKAAQQTSRVRLFAVYVGLGSATIVALLYQLPV